MAREVNEGLVTDGRPEKADIDKMHADRDAIRDEQGSRLVGYAAILYPGPAVHFDEGLEALSAVPGMEPDLEMRLAAVLTAALTSQAPEADKDLLTSAERTKDMRDWRHGSTTESRLA